MPKILFIQATQHREDGKGLVKQRRLYLPGLAFAHLAALTPPHWEVEICLEVIEDVPYDTDADLIGIGAMGQAVLHAREIGRTFKQLGKTVVMGGYMPSMIPEYVSADCDSVVIGDAERAYPQLLHDFENGCLQPVYNLPVEEFSKLPVPRYDLLVKKRIGFMLPVQAGRGCPHACSYCSIYCLYRQKYFTRPLEEVMRDIKKIKELGYRAFFLIDDNLVGNPRFFSELCDAIKPLKMIWATQASILLAKKPDLLRKAADSGCRILSIGIESISQAGLDRLNKKWVKVAEHETMLRRVTEAGILPATEMIVGTDEDTLHSLEETADFVMKARIPIPKFYVLTPMPGSDLYEEYRLQGRLLHEDYSRYTATDAVHRPEKISPEELTQMYWRIYKKVYAIPNILKRTIFHPHFFKRPLSFFFALYVNLKYWVFIRRGDAPNVL